MRSLADCGTHILILGEAGVGKTLVGRLIHSVGPRRDKALRSINFALIPEREQRLALFGREPPEATSELKGSLERDTTLLLRNLESAAPYIQQRLAEAIFERQYRRAVHGKSRSVLARIIFTASEGEFLDYRRTRLVPELRDLLRRLPKFVIPPLRDRVQDIPLIAAHYRKHTLKLTRPALPRDDTLLEPTFVRSYPWHENVTELKACLRAAVVYSHVELLDQKARLEFEKMMMILEEGGDFSFTRSAAIIEYHIVQRAASGCGNNRSRTAQTLGLSPSTLQEREQHG
jgi:DNA-binding NtrC family response regulator